MSNKDEKSCHPSDSDALRWQSKRTRMVVSRAIGARDPVIGCHMVSEGSVTVVLTSVMGHCATHTTHEACKEECECGEYWLSWKTYT